uniref:type II toxin-antitoxin system VapC family toxin n=1 Tax=uncultured Maritalea sp. TaxID=757249 RepID=UPI002624B7B1
YMTVLIDSNILIYAINTSSPKHSEAKTFLRELRDTPVIAHQNILEAFRILTHAKYSHPMPVGSALRSLNLLCGDSQMILPNSLTFSLLQEFSTVHKLDGNRVFDAYLAATALSNDVHTIATDNVKDFAKFSGLKVTNPFAKV